MSSDDFGSITGAMLRDIVVCPRRAWHDIHADPADRDDVPSFVQLLWAEGLAHEDTVVDCLEGRVADLRNYPGSSLEADTTEALRAGIDHVVGGGIAMGDLVGSPDLISRVDGRWIAGDVKSGTPWKANGRDAKQEYAVQVGLYASILEGTGVGAGDRAFIVGADGERAWYDMDAPWCGSTLRAATAATVDLARGIRDRVVVTRGASSAQCGLCHWRTLCAGELEAADDLTLVAGVGRKLRRDIEKVAATRTGLAELDLTAVVRPKGRTVVPGLGADRLRRFQARARLQLTPGAVPYARSPLGLTRSPREWHWDIEADPTSGGLVYLHGVWERTVGDDGVENGRFHHFFAEDGDGDGEREAFEGCWRLLTSDPDAAVFYYSPYERTAYRQLQRRHPAVCSVEEVEAFFASPRVIDLYTDIVAPLTEWPTRSYGIKALAKHCGFAWAATDASGAASIAWYQEWARTRDPGLREKIVDYNRSDCQASAVVLDALLALPVSAGPEWFADAPRAAELEEG